MRSAMHFGIIMRCFMPCRGYSCFFSPFLAFSCIFSPLHLSPLATSIYVSLLLFCLRRLLLASAPLGPSWFLSLYPVPLFLLSLFNKPAKTKICHTKRTASQQFSKQTRFNQVNERVKRFIMFTCNLPIISGSPQVQNPINMHGIFYSMKTWST